MSDFVDDNASLSCAVLSILDWFGCFSFSMPHGQPAGIFLFWLFSACLPWIFQSLLSSVTSSSSMTCQRKIDCYFCLRCSDCRHYYNTLVLISRELHRGNLSNPLNRLKRPFTQRKNVKSKVKWECVKCSQCVFCCFQWRHIHVESRRVQIYKLFKIKL